MKAFCWASGLVGFGRTAPDGTIVVAEGPAKPLREMMAASCRHSYFVDPCTGNPLLLIPGVPEAKDQDAGADALAKFISWRRGVNKDPSIKFSEVI